MGNILSLAGLVLFFGSSICAAQQGRLANGCQQTYGEVYAAVKAILFAIPDQKVDSVTALYFEPSWGKSESQITLQFPGKGSPIVTSYGLASQQKPISSTVSSAIKAGTCDAQKIAKGIRVIKKSIPMNERLAGLIDELWHLQIAPRPLRSLHLDATVYVLEVKGQENIRVVTDDYESPIVKWMDEMHSAVNQK